MHQKLISTLSQYNKIILVGGGTGGHIQPIVSLVHSLDNEVVTYLWIGGGNSQEEKTAKIENIEFQSIPTLKLATTRSWQSLLYPFFLIRGFWKARKILQGLKISEENIAVFSKGGPGSVAIGIAGWSLGIPLYIHESDTIPGRSNRILGKIATRIFLGFESARIYFDPKKCEVVRQILDPVFSRHPELAKQSRKEERELDRFVLAGGSIHWHTAKPHILVICGSQGSRAIFEEIITAFSGNSEYEWIVALGKLNSGMRAEFEKIPDCQALDWISQSDIATLIPSTDIAITRGSATTLAELTASQNPDSGSQESDIKLIIIPLPYSANNHQYSNALEYQKMGHTILEQIHLDQLNETIQQYV